MSSCGSFSGSSAFDSLSKLIKLIERCKKKHSTLESHSTLVLGKTYLKTDEKQVCALRHRSIKFM
jgi:hypothetical protein